MGRPRENSRTAREFPYVGNSRRRASSFRDKNRAVAVTIGRQLSCLVLARGHRVLRKFDEFEVLSEFNRPTIEKLRSRAQRKSLTRGTAKILRSMIKGSRASPVAELLNFVIDVCSAFSRSRRAIYLNRFRFRARARARARVPFAANCDA